MNHAQRPATLVTASLERFLARAPRPRISAGALLLATLACGPAEEEASTAQLAQATSALRQAPAVTTVAVLPTPSNDGLSFDRRGRLFVSHAGRFGAGALLGTEVYAVSPRRQVRTALEGLSGPLGSVSDRRGNLYVSNFNDGTIHRRDRRGRLAAFATLPGSGGGLALDSQGRLYAASFTSGTISRIAPDGSVELFSDDPLLAGPVGISFDENDALYVGNYNDGKVIRLLSDGAASVVADIGPVAGNNIGYLTYSRGCIYATSLNVNKVFAISPAGDFAELAGTGERGSLDGPRAEAQFELPNGITANARGTALFVTEYGSANLRSIRIANFACPGSETDRGTRTERGPASRRRPHR